MNVVPLMNINNNVSYPVGTTEYCSFCPKWLKERLFSALIFVLRFAVLEIKNLTHYFASQIVAIPSEIR